LNIKKHIPNSLSCLNLFCGCVACIAAFSGDFLLTGIWVVAGAVADFFDGFAARLLKSYSPIGKELDSLADDVTFGLAPAVAVFSFLQTAVVAYSFPAVEYIPYLAFLLAVFSALRLAKFNIDERQTSSFIGLPTPANALFWVSLLIGIEQYAATHHYVFWIVVALIIVFSFLLVCELPMFSLKMKNFSWKDNKLQYTLTVCIVVSVIFLKFSGLAVGILIYILLSVGCCLRKTGKFG
jgi:CDP-diacylglycerol--serine O-phosphatidyltransferase